MNTIKADTDQWQFYGDWLLHISNTLKVKTWYNVLNESIFDMILLSSALQIDDLKIEKMLIADDGGQSINKYKSLTDKNEYIHCDWMYLLDGPFMPNEEITIEYWIKCFDNIVINLDGYQWYCLSRQHIEKTFQFGTSINTDDFIKYFNNL